MLGPVPPPAGGRRRALAFLTALCSPVAALFAALVGGAYAIGPGSPPVGRPRADGPETAHGARTATAAPGPWAGIASPPALIPVGLLAVAFPEGGYEPFTFATLWPIPVIAADRAARDRA